MVEKATLFRFRAPGNNSTAASTSGTRMIHRALDPIVTIGRRVLETA